MGQRKIALITTGGTISTTTDPADGRTRPRLLADDLAKLGAVSGVSLEPREVSRVPSWTLGPEDMLKIARSAQAAAKEPGVDGVVVTHGTTTLEYTAFLIHLIDDGSTPIVLTGSMYRADSPEPDGPGNLRNAIRVAASVEASGLGPLVVFAGRLISAGSVWKARRVEADAFVDLVADVGAIESDDIRIDRRPSPGPRLSGRIDPAVGFVKVVPGMDGRLVEAAAAHARGLVIEALPGAGGLPPAMHATVRGVARLAPVVIASRAPFDRAADKPSGGTGEPLEGDGLLSPGSLTAEQAWLLLMMLFGEDDAAGSVGARFRAISLDRS